MFTDIDVTFLLILKFGNYGTKEVIVSTANQVLVGILITMGDVTRNIAMAFDRWTKENAVHNLGCCNKQIT